MAEAIVPLLLIGGATAGARSLIKEAKPDRLPPLPPPPAAEPEPILEDTTIDTLAIDSRDKRRRRKSRASLRIDPSINTGTDEPIQGLRISQ